MRIIAISFLALAMLTGCMSLHANIPEEVVRHHIAREEGVDLAALCSHAGGTFSEGAVLCMAERLMTCDPGGRWVASGSCMGERAAAGG